MRKSKREEQKATHLWTFSKSKFNLKSDHVNLVLLFTQCPGDTIKTGTGKVDPARKFKCTTAAHEADVWSAKKKLLQSEKKLTALFRIFFKKF